MTQPVQYNVRDSQGNVYGPATADMLRQWVKEGRIVAGMSIAPEGTDQWTEVSVHPNLSDLFGGSPAAAASPNSAPTGAPTSAIPVSDTSIIDAPASAAPVDPLTSAAPAPPADPAAQTPITGNTTVVRSTNTNLTGLGYETPQLARSNTLALISFIAGILALLSSVSACCCYGTINGLLGLVALVLGLVAVGQNRKEPGAYNNNWMAVTGIILGVLAVLISIGVIVFFVIAMISSHTS